MLIETDSPHLPVLRGFITTTLAYIDVAAGAAFIRKEPIPLLLERTRVKGEMLYSRPRAYSLALGKGKRHLQALGIQVWGFFNYGCINLHKIRQGGM